jgi:tetratricopeptide (TPR) repeat protein
VPLVMSTPDSSGVLEVGAANDPDDLVDTSAAAAAGCVEATSPETKKMFFTASDLIERMNSAIRDANDDIPTSTSNSLRDSDRRTEGNTGGFELQMKLPDGSYRRAEQKEIAAADFQTKMKQASEIIVGLTAQQKIEWAKCQRIQGNVLFAKGDYTEAMDVYLTCLVAMDQSCPTPTSNDENPSSDITMNENASESRLLQVQMEREIKLPVLLNLALCSLKMGMLSKAEKFCNFAMETELGKQSPKASFCRGRARLLMGKYGVAESDLNNALNLLRAKRGMSAEMENRDLKDGEDEEAVILREKLKLQKLVHRAQTNRNQQKKAMEKMFQPYQNEGCRDAADGEITRTTPSLYPEKQCLPKNNQVLQHDGNEGITDKEAGCQPTYVQWYLQMMGRCAQKILDIIGDDEENDEVDVPIDQDLLNRLMECKKNA